MYKGFRTYKTWQRIRKEPFDKIIYGDMRERLLFIHKNARIHSKNKQIEPNKWQ